MERAAQLAVLILLALNGACSLVFCASADPNPNTTSRTVNSSRPSRHFCTVIINSVACTGLTNRLHCWYIVNGTMQIQKTPLLSTF